MKYQKRPVQVEAVQYNPENLSLEELFKHTKQWNNYFSETPDWLVDAIDSIKIKIILVSGKHKAEIETLEGEMKLKDGAYIIKGVQGEIYACDKDIFHETYEEVTK